MTTQINPLDNDTCPTGPSTYTIEPVVAAQSSDSFPASGSISPIVSHAAAAISPMLGNAELGRSVDEGPPMLCEQHVRDRGWSPADIRDHLHPPDESGHNRHNPRAPLRLYCLDRVLTAEAEAWWSRDRQRLKKIRTAQARRERREHQQPPVGGSPCLAGEFGPHL